MNTAPDMFSSGLQMLMALGIVLGGLLGIFYLLKRYLKRDAGGSGAKLVRVIASQYVGIKKNIALVEVPGAVLVVGISTDNISLLTKIEDKEVLAGLRQETCTIAPSFTDQLQRFTSRFRSVGKSE
jgi:flagellar protein FliO/FliZ